jgi:hypothetical protein
METLFDRGLEARVYMTRPPALRGIAGYIQKIAPFPTLRADIRRSAHCNGKTALFAFPIGQTTLGTDITDKPAVSRVSAKRTLSYFFFGLHLFTLFFLNDLVVIFSY